MTNNRIFLSPPHMSGNEMAYIEEVFQSNMIAPLGPMVDRFERDICAYTGYPYATALTTGTAALHLALLGLGVKQGDVVWASSLTFIASVSPITFCGATPVFFDASLIDWNIDCDLIEEQLILNAKKNNLPKAILVTDLYGQPCDYTRLNTLCQTYGVALLSDSAESLGSSYAGTKNPSPTAVYSFNGNKIITTSGGGMLVSKDKKLIDHARFLSQQAREPYPYYEHEVIGNNYRMSNVLAAIGVAQLGVLDERVLRKKEIFETYQKGFKDIDAIAMMPMPQNRTSNYWLSVITLDARSPKKPEDLRLMLESHNIESRPVWKPMHMQPVFKDAQKVGGKISENLFQTGLCLPSGSRMTKDDQTKIINLICESFSK